jgi:hypothetical protein
MRFRFTIRDLLWLTLVIGLVIGWVLDRRMHDWRFEALDQSTSVVNMRILQGNYRSAMEQVRTLEADNQRLRTESIGKSPQQ